MKSYYWLCAGMFILGVDIIHAAELSKPRRLYMQVSPKDRLEKVISKKRPHSKRSRIVHTPCLYPIPEERSVKQKSSISTDATPTSIVSVPSSIAPEQSKPKLVPSPELRSLPKQTQEEHKKEVAPLTPLERRIRELSAQKPKSRAEYLAQQKAIREASLIQLKAAYEAIREKNVSLKTQADKLATLHYDTADKIVAFVRKKNLSIAPQQYFDRLKKEYGQDRSHLFFNHTMRLVDQCDLSDADLNGLYSSFIHPFEELDDKTEPYDTTADDLLKLIKKIEKPCPCLTADQPCKKCVPF